MKKSKILAILLTVVMVMTLVPAVVMAETTTEIVYVDMTPYVTSDTIGVAGDPIPTNWFANLSTGSKLGFNLAASQSSAQDINIPKIIICSDKSTKEMPFLVADAYKTGVADCRIINKGDSYEFDLQKVKSNELYIAMIGASGLSAGSADITVTYTDHTQDNPSQSAFASRAVRSFAVHNNSSNTNNWSKNMGNFLGYYKRTSSSIIEDATTGNLKSSNTSTGFVVHKFVLEEGKIPSKVTISAHSSSSTGHDIQVYGIAQQISSNTVTVTATTDGIGGTIAVNGAASADVTRGDNVTLTVTPDAGGYVLQSLTDGETDYTSQVVNGALTLPIEEYTDFVATFIRRGYVDVKAAAAENGTITVNGADSVAVPEGSEVEIAVAPAEGYKLDTLSDGTTDYAPQVADGKVSVTVSADTTFTATFIKTEIQEYHYVDMTSVVNSDTIGVDDDTIDDKWFANVTNTDAKNFGLKLGATHSISVFNDSSSSSAVTSKTMDFLVADGYKTCVNDARVVNAANPYTFTLKPEKTDKLLIAAVGTAIGDYASEITVNFSDGTKLQRDDYITSFRRLNSYTNNWGKNGVDSSKLSKFFGYYKWTQRRLAPDGDGKLVNTFDSANSTGYAVYQYDTEGKIPVSVTIAPSDTAEDVLVYGIAQKVTMKNESSYTVTAAACENGSINVNGGASAEVNKGEAVEIAVTPAEGYQLKTLIGGGIDCAFLVKDGKVSVVVTEDTTFTATFVKKTEVADIESAKLTAYDAEYAGGPSIISYYKITIPEGWTVEKSGMLLNGLDLVSEATTLKDGVFGIRVFGAAINMTDSYTAQGYVKFAEAAEIKTDDEAQLQFPVE